MSHQWGWRGEDAVAENRSQTEERVQSCLLSLYESSGIRKWQSARVSVRTSIRSDLCNGYKKCTTLIAISPAGQPMDSVFKGQACLPGGGSSNVENRTDPAELRWSAILTLQMAPGIINHTCNLNQYQSWLFINSRFSHWVKPAAGPKLVFRFLVSAPLRHMVSVPERGASHVWVTCQAITPASLEGKLCIKGWRHCQRQAWIRGSWAVGRQWQGSTVLLDAAPAGNVNSCPSERPMSCASVLLFPLHIPELLCCVAYTHLLGLSKGRPLTIVLGMGEEPVRMSHRHSLARHLQGSQKLDPLHGPCPSDQLCLEVFCSSHPSHSLELSMAMSSGYQPTLHNALYFGCESASHPISHSPLSIHLTAV